MRNQEDIALDPAQKAGWSNTLTPSNGLLTGITNGNSGAQVALLQRGWYNINNPGRNGDRFPLDPTIYTKVSWKMSTTAAEFPRIYWFQQDIGAPNEGAGTGSRLFLGPNSTQVPPGTKIYLLDMIQPPGPSPTWQSAPIKSVSLFPNDGINPTTPNTIGLSWMRVTVADNHPAAKIVHIAWSGGTGSTNISVTDAGGTAYQVATGAPGQAFDFNYGILPPGAYTLTVGGTTRSFTINAPPAIQVTDPDDSGGEDFATAVLGNPWDMTDANDYFVNVNIVDHLILHQPGPSGFTGRSDGVQVGSTPGGVPIGDAQLYLLSKQKPADGPLIDSTKYHRLTYSLQVDHAYNLTTGSVARVLWGSQSSDTGGGVPYDVTTSKDILVWEGMNTYTLDLATMTTSNGGLEPNNATLWTANNIRHFRIDPFEFAEVVDFHLKNVKLAADDTTSGGTFTIRFAGSDPEGDPTTVALYYDTDTNPASGLTPITSGLALSTGQYVWRTGTTVPAGSYYIYAVANDGHSSMGRYSSGPVRVIPATLPPLLTGGDFDGDARGDAGLYKANGEWAILTSGSGYASSIVKAWGGAGYTPVPGDYDGDGKQDIAVYREATGDWSILRSSSNYTTVLSFNFGGSGYKPVPGDYDGDGRTDLGVYQPANGAWSILKSTSGFTTTLSAGWGGAGFLAVGGQDFDGDGKSDIGVYQPSTGNWYVLLSSTNFSSPISVTWGGAGCVLVPGDYDGDGKADPAFYAPSTGAWSVLRSSSNYTTSFTVNWGGAGYLPVPADYDGDRLIDLAIFQRSTGNWSILKSSSNYTTTLSITGWGGPNDLPLSSAIATGGSDSMRASDFDGDGRSDITVYQASSAFWYTLKSSGNYATAMNRSWGGTGYTPAPGDYDGDGKTDYAIYQQSSGNWYILLSGAGYTTSLTKSVGGAGWIPVPGDYDGDGRTDLVVYNTTSGLWYGLKSVSNYTTTLSINWGGTGYTAAPGDFDGDAKVDLAIYQASTGNWYVLLSGANFTTSISKSAGGAGYVPVQGDYDGDGKADFAVYNTTSGLWYALKSSTGYTTTLAVNWGGSGYAPVRGDFDADGKLDLVLYQSSSGQWFVLLSGANYTTTLSKNWGGTGYAPVPAFP